jgi:hypothetical protein
MVESRSGEPDKATRALTPAEAEYVAAARTKAFILYEGTRVAHRSCGIALAETFGLPTPAYQSLRRGGITGKGACGAIRAGEQVLGEILGDPNPAGGVTPELRAAISWYQDVSPTRLPTGNAPDIVCNTLVRPHGDFMGPARKAFCTNLAAEVAAVTAEAIVRFGTQQPAITPVTIDSDEPKAT